MTEREMYSLAYHLLRLIRRERARDEKICHFRVRYNPVCQALEKLMLKECTAAVIANASDSLRQSTCEFVGKVW